MYNFSQTTNCEKCNIEILKKNSKHRYCVKCGAMVQREKDKLRKLNSKILETG